MTNPNTITTTLTTEMKIFKMNDCDWWLAPTLDEAVEDFGKFYSPDSEDMLESPHELSEADLDRLKYCDEDEHGQQVKRTFREELARRVAAGAKTEMFATTEF